MILRAVPALDRTLSFPDTSCPTGLPEHNKAGSQCLPNALLVPSTAGTLRHAGPFHPRTGGKWASVLLVVPNAQECY